MSWQKFKIEKIEVCFEGSHIPGGFGRVMEFLIFGPSIVVQATWIYRICQLNKLSKPMKLVSINTAPNPF